MTSLPDLFTIILCNIPDATRDGNPEAVADLTSGCEDLHAAMGPLVEVLSHPENLGYLKRWRTWLRRHYPNPEQAPAEVVAMLALFNALEGLTNE